MVSKVPKFVISKHEQPIIIKKITFLTIKVEAIKPDLSCVYLPLVPD